MTFGDTLRELLDTRGLTQKQLASDLNIAASTLGNYIQNSREPDFHTLKQLATYFHVSVDYLLDFRSEHAKSRLEDELLTAFRCLTPSQQKDLTVQVKALVKNNHKS